jgi:L-lactate dehydrogenase complex protein LldE
MNVALFVPCYIDQFYPRVAVATMRLLERLGCTVRYPKEQTCCGQPMANAGFEDAARPAARHFAETFAGCDYVVAPSGSCVLHVREHLGLAGDTAAVRHLRERTFELCRFLDRFLDLDRLDVSFPHRVGYHAACHGLRGLRLGRAGERMAPDADVVRDLLGRVAGLTLVALDRADECCGFGGAFAVTEEAVSVRMGRDRLRDHLTHGAEVITATDMSCLMHLEGLARRQGAPVRFLHIAEILNGSR